MRLAMSYAASALETTGGHDSSTTRLRDTGLPSDVRKLNKDISFSLRRGTIA
jgi:hypothetical protein